MSAVDILRALSYCDQAPIAPRFDDHQISYGFLGKNSSIDSSALIRPTQVHGINIAEVKSGAGKIADKADGIYSKAKDVVVAVVTADCLPVLLAAKDKSIVMALHAGWRGLSSGILNEGYKLFLQHGIKPADLLVGIGPCISPQNYEVGPEVLQSFQTGGIALKQENFGYMVTKGKTDRWYLDLAVAGALVFIERSVPAKNISIVRTCTYQNADQYFSYRRTKTYEGNNVSWISCSRSLARAQ